MFIWTAVDVNDQLIELRNMVKEIEKDVHFGQSDLTLPMHISLIISKEIPNEKYDDVIRDMRKILGSCNAFSVNVKGIELHETISWLAMEPNEQLEKLHEQLCRLFSEKYGIQLHKFDTEFRYHSTLLLDNDEKAVKEAFLKIMDTPVPSEIRATRFVIGGSETGAIGSYRVFETIEMKE